MSETRTVSTASRGIYTQDPTLRWLSGFDGVTPISGLSASVFTFDIEYVSEGNTPPTLAEVWIDASQNGIYEEARTPILPIYWFATPLVGGVVLLVGFMLSGARRATKVRVAQLSVLIVLVSGAGVWMRLNLHFRSLLRVSRRNDSQCTRSTEAIPITPTASSTEPSWRSQRPPAQYCIDSFSQTVCGRRMDTERPSAVSRSIRHGWLDNREYPLRIPKDSD